MDPSGKSGIRSPPLSKGLPRKSSCGCWDMKTVRTTNSDRLRPETWVTRVVSHTGRFVSLEGGVAESYIEKIAVNLDRLRQTTTRGHCGWREFTGSQH